MLALVAAPNSGDLLEMREVPDPTPLYNEAVVDVKAISLNRGELHRLQTAAHGWRPGWDIAGIVSRAAADGTGPQPGVRVVGVLPAGGWCSQVAVPISAIATLPEHVTFAQAAALPVAGLTALWTLRLGGNLLGRRVLVTGAAGGVGRFAVQLARRAGAVVTALVGSESRTKGLSELGAQHIAIETIPKGQEFDLILESVGGTVLAQSFSVVASNGTIVTFGNSSKEETTFLVNGLYLKGGARLYGFFLFSEMKWQPVGPDLDFLLSLVAAGEMDPQVATEADWHEAGAVLAGLRDRRIAGKAVLRVT
ncbi:MAG: zinc-binding dehydrogenase [Vulcanimicrobiaceae bacterium]